MASSQQLYMISVPNQGKKPEGLLAALQKQVAEEGNSKIHKFDIPALNVGTLDSLMALSDDLVKMNSQVENVVRKVERQYNEISGAGADPLKINDMPIDKYLRNFQWDFARYRFQGRPLTDLVSQVQGVAAKVDEELKKLSQTYMEKQQNLSGLQRKKTANLATADFEDVLTPAEVQKIEVLDSETLATLFVVVPVALEKDFLNNYSTLGDTIANYGGPEWNDVFSVGKNDGRFGAAISATRAACTGSPVAPGSAVKVKTEGDMSLFTIVALKGQYEAGSIVAESKTVTEGKFVDYIEPLKSAFRDKRFVIREFSYDASKAGSLDGTIEKAKMDVQQTATALVRWCMAHFGELYVGWMHLKVIRTFAESVLRYGLPVDFLSVIVEPNMRKEKSAFKTITRAIIKLRPELKAKTLSTVFRAPGAEQASAAPGMVDKMTGGMLAKGAGGIFGGEEVPSAGMDEEDEDEEELGDGADAADNMPFVCQSFPVVGCPAFK